MLYQMSYSYDQSFDLLYAALICGRWIRTIDLQIMSLTSFQTALPRHMKAVFTETANSFKFIIKSFHGLYSYKPLPNLLVLISPLDRTSNS